MRIFLFFFSIWLAILYQLDRNSFRQNAFFRNCMIYAKPKDFFCDNSSRTEISSLAKKVLDQEFSYLGRGKDCFCFEDISKQYVVKIQKFKPPIFEKWWCVSPLYYLRKSSLEDQINYAKKRKNLIESYTKALSFLKEETNLVDGYFFPQRGILKIKDKNQFSYEIFLNKCTFFIQKKGGLCFESLECWYNHGHIELAKEGVDSLITLLVRLYQKGFTHDDCLPHKNLGFDGTKAFFIDIGDFRELSKEETELGLKVFLREKTSELDSFLKNKEELYSFYKALLEKF